MKLTYWVAPVMNDAQCYNVRAKTKRECLAKVDETGIPGDYGTPRKVTVEYASGFDLLEQCLEEGGLYEECELLWSAPLERRC